MNWDTLKGQWKQIKGKVRERWGALTDDEIDTIGGQKDQLVGKLQSRYGISREQAEAQVSSWEKKRVREM